MQVLGVTEVVVETEKAWCMRLNSTRLNVAGGCEWWLPKSKCSYDSYTNEVAVPDWLYAMKIEEDEAAEKRHKKYERLEGCYCPHCGRG